MLQELTVENYAVIERATLRFGAGLTVLTGETGSGKSLVVDSLALLFGGRSSTELIRSGETRARVTGIFELPATSGMEPELRNLFEEAGIELDGDNDLIVEREVTAGGKSRAYIANRPVTTAFLRRLAPLLGDIHGQNEQQSLFQFDAQRSLLDEYAGAGDMAKKVGELYREWRDALAAVDEWAATESEKLRLLDLWTFQRNEIDAVAPKAGEDSELESERAIQANLSRLQESSAAAYDLLYEAEGSASAQLKTAIKRVDDLVRIDSSTQALADGLRQAAVQINDAAFELRDYGGKLEGDAGRLESIESRLAALDRLKRKYGGTLAEVLIFRDDVARRAGDVENATSHRESLEQKARELESAFSKRAEELSVKRRAAARKLSKAVSLELQSLAMAGTRLEIAVRPAPPAAHGSDEVEFLVSPNRGEELRSLEKIASGGELSRIALALKTALGRRNSGSGQTLVFDEVDAGVGGAAAAAVGRRLKTLAKANQVICVTHLPQIAGFADRHYAVVKGEHSGRTRTEVRDLSREQRAEEIGRMLSGDKITPEALRQAEQLMLAAVDS